jgi:hypothetical protein
MQASMQHAMCLASIFGPFLMILGFWKLFYRSNVTKVITSIKTTPGVMYMLGVINLLVGLTVVSMFNMWVWNISLLVTLVGWALLVRGLLAFFFPQVLVHKKMATPGYFKVKGVVLLVWGFFLCWFAF